MKENEAIEVLKDFGKQVTAKADGAYQTDVGKMACDTAIKALEEVQQYRKNGITVENAVDDMCNLICAKSLIAEYRAIGTPELCRMAVRKQTARRSLHQGCYDKDGVWHEWNGINGKPYELCPSCGVNLCCEMPLDIKPKYCKNCGQKLDWRNEE